MGGSLLLLIRIYEIQGDLLSDDMSHRNITQNLEIPRLDSKIVLTLCNLRSTVNKAADTPDAIQKDRTTFNPHLQY